MIKLPTLLLLTFISLSLPSPAPSRRTLDLYFIDSEGGAATLIVTPAAESILIDAGWPDPNARDAKRIQQAMQQAGITHIDHLVVSHYHQDHYGGVPDIARLVPVKRFYDHGKMTVMTEDSRFAERYAAYQAAAKNETTTLQAGDAIPLRTANGTPPIQLLTVAADAKVISNRNLEINAECGSITPLEDTTENGRSVGLLLRWGKFEFLNLADLTFNISQRLVCPVNQIGNIELYQVTHHGGDVNNNPVLLRSLRPPVSIMINGPHKGGHPDTIASLQKTPRFKALYQLHRNVDIPAEQNTPAQFIANLDEQPDAAHLIMVSVDAAKKTFTVTNSRTNERKSFSFK
jgi:competence protein ComEC